MRDSSVKDASHVRGDTNMTTTTGGKKDFVDHKAWIWMDGCNRYQACVDGLPGTYLVVRPWGVQTPAKAATVQIADVDPLLRETFIREETTILGCFSVHGPYLHLTSWQIQ